MKQLLMLVILLIGVNQICQSQSFINNAYVTVGSFKAFKSAGIAAEFNSFKNQQFKFKLGIGKYTVDPHSVIFGAELPYDMVIIAPEIVWLQFKSKLTTEIGTGVGINLQQGEREVLNLSFNFEPGFNGNDTLKQKPTIIAKFNLGGRYTTDKFIFRAGVGYPEAIYVSFGMKI